MVGHQSGRNYAHRTFPSTMGPHRVRYGYACPTMDPINKPQILTKNRSPFSLLLNATRNTWNHGIIDLSLIHALNIPILVFVHLFLLTLYKFSLCKFRFIYLVFFVSFSTFTFENEKLQFCENLLFVKIDREHGSNRNIITFPVSLGSQSKEFSRNCNVLTSCKYIYQYAI